VLEFVLLQKTAREHFHGKIWEVDPLGCFRCGHEVKIIKVIYQTDFIERILRHLWVWKQYTNPHERIRTHLHMGRL
jgi:hypothetical protein